VTEESNPFDMSSVKDALTQRRTLSTGLEWRVSQGLLNALFSLFRAYLERGSPREAQYFAGQSKELAESLNAPARMYRALVKDVEIKLLQEIEHWVQEDGSAHIDLAELYRIKGDMDQRGAMAADAQKHYEDAMAVIEKVDRNFNSADGLNLGVFLPPQSRLDG
jgi:separase